MGEAVAPTREPGDVGEGHVDRALPGASAHLEKARVVQEAGAGASRLLDGCHHRARRGAEDQVALGDRPADLERNRQPGKRQRGQGEPVPPHGSHLDVALGVLAGQRVDLVAEAPQRPVEGVGVGDLHEEHRRHQAAPAGRVGHVEPVRIAEMGQQVALEIDARVLGEQREGILEIHLLHGGQELPHHVAQPADLVPADLGERRVRGHHRQVATGHRLPYQRVP